MYARFIRAGEPVVVWLAESAYVTPRSDNRSAIAGGWTRRPLSNGLELLVRDDITNAATERSTTERTGTSDIARAVIAAEAVRRAEHDRRFERSATGQDRADIEIAPFLGIDLAAWPVAIPADSTSALFPTGEIVMRRPAGQTESVDDIADAVGCRYDRPLAFLPDGHVFRVDDATNPYDAADLLIDGFGCEVAHPVFMEELGGRLPAALDIELPALLDEQWHLSMANVLEAWRHTLGRPDIVVAVVDSGINEAHECFGPDRFVPGYDFADHDDDPHPTTSSHGTACAALVAAGSATSSVVGVAPGVRLMSIRRGQLSSHLAMAEALVWAADHGADILSCSFGYDGRPWILPDIVHAAFEHITTNGRAGRGAVIVWAAGNGGESISTDEWASSPLTISVGAVTETRELAPYSDTGPELDLVGPSSGGERSVVTAINEGYTVSFGGTSASAPMVAGVAALILSLAPELAEPEIRALLTSTAKALPPGTTTAERNDRFGHGLIDAARAVAAIDTVAVLIRRAGLDDRRADLTSFLEYFRERGASDVLEALAARIDPLLLATHDPRVGVATQTVLHACAEMGAQIADGNAPSVPAGINPALETIASAITS
ncbi:MAG: S8 family serine peptidase [Actinomycetota bacterium]